jgi:hypothetical protein
MAGYGGKRKNAGRPKGVKNKSTQKVRDAIAKFSEDNVEQFAEWVKRVAEDDPKGAADIFLKAIEYHIPKLARQEITGKDGEDISIKSNLDVSKLTTEQLKAIQAAKINEPN